MEKEIVTKEEHVAFANACIELFEGITKSSGLLPGMFKFINIILILFFTWLTLLTGIVMYLLFK